MENFIFDFIRRGYHRYSGRISKYKRKELTEEEQKTAKKDNEHENESTLPDHSTDGEN